MKRSGPLTTPDAVKAFYGDHVTITATTDEGKKSVHIDTIAEAKIGLPGFPNAGDSPWRVISAIVVSVTLAGAAFEAEKRVETDVTGNLWHEQSGMAKSLPRVRRR